MNGEHRAFQWMSFSLARFPACGNVLVAGAPAALKVTAVEYTHGVSVAEAHRAPSLLGTTTGTSSTSLGFSAVVAV